MEPSTGYFVASSSVRADVTGASLKEFLAEIADPRRRHLRREAVKARETLRTEIVQSFEGLPGLLGQGTQAVVNGVPFKTIADDLAAARACNAPALNTLAKDSVPLQRRRARAGRGSPKVLPQLKGLGLPPPAICRRSAGTPATGDRKGGGEANAARAQRRHRTK